ncbi:hypothetical protein F4824DRAFT_88125 [Ustulina deusta]|nr:hypothetical protein F4824DRAFT_88125 [Ustulina deusta]
MSALIVLALGGEPQALSRTRVKDCLASRATFTDSPLTRGFNEQRGSSLLARYIHPHDDYNETGIIPFWAKRRPPRPRYNSRTVLKSGCPQLPTYTHAVNHDRSLASACTSYSPPVAWISPRDLSVRLGRYMRWQDCGRLWRTWRVNVFKLGTTLHVY